MLIFVSSPEELSPWGLRLRVSFILLLLLLTTEENTLTRRVNRSNKEQSREQHYDCKPTQ